jgi:imidazolonepropionase
MLSTGASVALAAEYQAASVDHREYATAGDAALLSCSPTVATLLPGSSFHRVGRYAPAGLIEAGAAVALATNFNPDDTPTLNMQAIVQLACCGHGHDSGGSHFGGHHQRRSRPCLRRYRRFAGLGKSADVLILNISDYHELAHHFGMNLVHTTIKHGEIMWEQGKVAPRPVEYLRPCW